MSSPMVRSIQELLHEVVEVAQEVRDQRSCYQANPVGLEGDEGERFDVALKEAEASLMGVAAELHKAQGIMLTATVRWLAREHAGQDPTKKETPH